MNGKVVHIILQSCSFVLGGKDVGKDGLNMHLRQLHFYVDRKEQARKRIFFTIPRRFRQDLPTSFGSVKYISTLFKYTDSIKQNHLFSSSLQTHLPKCSSFTGRTWSLEHYLWGLCTVGRKHRDTAVVKEKKRVVKSLLVWQFLK